MAHMAKIVSIGLWYMQMRFMRLNLASWLNEVTSISCWNHFSNTSHFYNAYVFTTSHGA
jgi:hypothetical protein